MGLPGTFSKSVITVGVIAMIAFSLVGCVSSGEGEASQAADKSSSYTVECSRLVAGAERNVELSDGTVVSWTRDIRDDPLDGDGMADGLESYTFTALSPGTAYVAILNVLPWDDREDVEDLFRLVIDDDLNIVREEVPLVERFELREQGDVAAYRVLAAEPGDAGWTVSIFRTQNVEELCRLNHLLCAA